MPSTGYLIGCVRSRTGRLFSDEQRQRFVSVPTFADLERLLVDYYTENKRVLQAPQVKSFIWQKYDAHNLKIILREKITGKVQRHLLLDLGTISLAVLYSIVDGRKPDIGIWNSVYALPQDEIVLAKAIDALYYKSCLANATEPGLKILAQSMIDVANIKKCVARESDYIQGGSRLVSWWQAQEDFTVLLKEIIHAEPKEEDLEQFLDEWLFTKIQTYRYAAIGLMPLILYFMELELEIKNIKINYLAVQKKYPSLQQLVRKAYV